MRSVFSFLILLLASAAAFGQQTVPIAGASVYKNAEHGFSVELPTTWRIAGDGFVETAAENGIDVGLEAPKNIGKVGQLQVERALERVKVLMTATRVQANANDNAILRISTEDIRTNPAIKDAVDYFDLMRQQFAVMRLPADFAYSETNAERLGSKQFAFLDTSSRAGKKRMYATVRNGFAIMFTLSYTKPEDLKTLRDVLTKADFSLKN